MASVSPVSCRNFNVTPRPRPHSTPARVHRLHIFSHSPAGASEYSQFSNLLIDRCEKSQEQVILLEKYKNGTSKRYVVETDSGIRTILEEHLPEASSSSVEHGTKLSWLPKVVQDFILPAGFPDSVSDDYLEYILLQFPTNVTGWICHTLVTSSLLKSKIQAVGVGSLSGTTAAASAAAIRWVSKDGIGAGGLLIGGRFSNLFNDDPKQWRLYADFIGSVGSIFDLTTPLYPAYFLPLASLGNLAKAVGRGLRDPSFRVIQSHFAISENLGEVSAKEEVWEVAAELVGLGLGILALDTPGISSSYLMLTSTWLAVRLLHLWFRYLSLSVLRFNTINLKRARILISSYILHQKVPGIIECNKMENILVCERFLRPKIVFGVSLEEMISGKNPGSMVKMLLKLYAEEKYFLVMSQQLTEFVVFVSFKEGASSLSVLRSVWQSYWLQQRWSGSGHDEVISQLKQSLSALEDNFNDFYVKLGEAGWNVNQMNLKVPKEISVQEYHHTL